MSFCTDMSLNFELMPSNQQVTTTLIEKENKEKKVCPFAALDVCTRCEQNDSGQSCLGILLYVTTICILFFCGYHIYIVLEIHQDQLTSVDMFGNLCTVGFLSFVPIVCGCPSCAPAGLCASVTTACPTIDVALLLAPFALVLRSW